MTNLGTLLFARCMRLCLLRFCIVVFGVFLSSGVFCLLLGSGRFTSLLHAFPGNSCDAFRAWDITSLSESYHVACLKRNGRQSMAVQPNPWLVIYQDIE